MREQLTKAGASSKNPENKFRSKEMKDRLMKHKKEEPTVSGNRPVQPQVGTRRAEKIRSSRFEWEAKTGDGENAHGEPNAAQRSLMASLAGWLARLFSGSRDFFDKDDDATPSAA